MGEIVFCDLGNVCEPKDNISELRRRDKWASVAYETSSYQGTMLVSMYDAVAEDVLLDPKLKGMYKIYVGLYGYFNTENIVDIKLSKDESFVHMATSFERNFSEQYVEEVFWRASEMEGQQVVIGKHLSKTYSASAMIAWIRFVPMTEEEIIAYEADCEKQKNKRIYATNDMHGMLCYYDMSTREAWRNVVQEYIHSDVEWLAMEYLLNDGELSYVDVENFMFATANDKSFSKRLTLDYSQDMLRDLVKMGHRNGLKMCISLRICEWNFEFPHDKIAFERKFWTNNKALRCVDRDGQIIEYLSFAHKEVRDYLVEQFVKMAQTGCDAVQVLFSRGWPYVLFERPFLELFESRYHTDARCLAMDDERIVAVKCEIMTDFMKQLRQALDQVRETSRVELHAKVLFSMYDCKYMGLDLEEWAKLGLVDAIVSDERRIREVLDESVWMDETREKIDLKKYTDYVRCAKEDVIRYDYDTFFAPFPDSKGVLRGPVDQRERISEFMQLEKQYGVTVYIEIMPRRMSTNRIKEKALEIYDCGCEHIGLWDTYSRVMRKVEWSMWKRIGHKEELKTFSDGEGDLYRRVRILKIGGKDVSRYRPIWGG